jgi:hypothetical protein
MSNEDGIIESEIVSEEQKRQTRETTAMVETTNQALDLTKGTDLKAPSAAITAQLIASIQARYIMAERHPRDLAKVKERMLEWCSRPKFAEAARYKKPMGGAGKFIEGFSVRFVETAVREMGNVMSGDLVVHDDPEKRIIKMAFTDLERNVFDDHDITVMKRVERRYPKEGQRVISSRINSAGKEVFLVEATEDEIETKLAAMRSKSYRTLGLKFVPPDIREECEKRIKQTAEDYARRQPDEARKRIIEAFAEKSISEADLASYLKHPMDHVTAEEIVELRAVYLTIHEGEATWREIMEAIHGIAPVEGTTAGPKLEEVKDSIRRRKASA